MLLLCLLSDLLPLKEINVGRNKKITHRKKQQTKYHLADRHVIFTTYCKSCKK